MALDIANAGVARGKIYLAKEKELPIPPGWAIDAEGASTTDASAAIECLILPMAQHKGYPIAVMMDVLSGVLTGSGFGTGVHGPYQFDQRSRAGQLMIVLDIEKFQPIAEFNARVDRLIAELRSVPLAKDVAEIFYPGEIEARNDAANRRDGLLLPDNVLGELRDMAIEAGLQAPAV